MEFIRDILISGAPADTAGVMFDPTRDHEWMTAVASSVPVTALQLAAPPRQS